MERRVGKQLPNAGDHKGAETGRRLVDLRDDTSTAIYHRHEVLKIVTAVAVTITAIEERGVLRREEGNG